METRGQDRFYFTTTTTSFFITKRKLSIGYGHSLGFRQAWGRCPGIVSPPLSFAFTFLSSIHGYLLL
jgi:hypothetical protein